MAIVPAREALVKAQVEADFAAMDQAAANMPAGILDVIQVFGNYADAVQQANAYLSLLSPQVPAISTDSSIQN